MTQIEHFQENPRKEEGKRISNRQTRSSNIISAMRECPVATSSVV